jgi:DNA-binding LytR/AlgR family response regulator
MSSQRSILIVEDDPQSARLIETMLLDMGYNVTATVTSVQAAEHLVADSKPDLVISEVHLQGGTDGLLMAEKARESDLPIILISGQPDDALYQQAKALHPVAFLGKPLDRYTLQGTIEMALEYTPPVLPHDVPLEIITDADLIFVKSNNLLIQVRPSDVLYVHAEGNYATLVLPQRRIPAKMSLAQVIELLDPKAFIQVHRNYVVRVSEIESISLSHHELTVRGQIIPVSRYKFRDDLLRRVKMIK